MKYYSCTDAPIKIYGVEVIDAANQIFWRLPDEESRLVSEDVRGRSKSACGGRIRFRTDADSVNIRLGLHTLGVDICMPLPGASGLDVYTGAGIYAKYRGYVAPGNYSEEAKVTEKEVPLRFCGEPKEMRDVTLNLPRNERISEVTIGFPDDAKVEEPTPYADRRRICYYGSSITEGGCATRPGNAYTAAVSRWMDCDYVNFGFSGMARGELTMADIIAKRKFDIFVYDYDHNAPNAEHLEATHEPFYRRVREQCPDLPILMMSKPDFDADPVGNARRRDVIYRTYVNARAAGDEKVWFLDGESFFGVVGRESCTVDNCHPNDLGFYRMAEAVWRVLAKI